MKTIISTFITTLILLLPFLSSSQVEVIQNGNVGIGINTPSAKLEVHGTSSSQSILNVLDENAQSAFEIFRVGGVRLYTNHFNYDNYLSIRGIHPDSRWVIEDENLYPLITYRANNKLLGLGKGEFASGGINSAIGIMYRAAPYTDNGIVHIPRLRIAGNNTGPANISQLLIERSDFSEYNYAENYPNGQNNYLISTSLFTPSDPANHRAPINFGAYSFEFRTGIDNSDPSVLSINEIGNVGVGTSNPQSIFDVATSYTYDGNGPWHAKILNATATNTSSASPHAQYFINNQMKISGTMAMGNVIGDHSLLTVSNSSSSNYVRATYSRINMVNSGSAHSVALASTHFEGTSSGTIKNFYANAIGAIPGVSQFQNPNTTIDNTFGLYIGDLTEGTQTNTPYSIYISDDQTHNYIAGDVGVGTLTPSEKLHVIGNIKASGSVMASCGTLSCSDVRYKKNFLPLQNVQEKLGRINAVYYNWRQSEFPDMHFDDKTYLGFKAQEVEKEFPEIVHTDDKGYKSVDYSRMTVVLLEAMKEQQEQMALLQKENALLKKQVAAIANYLEMQSENNDDSVELNSKK